MPASTGPARLGRSGASISAYVIPASASAASPAPATSNFPLAAGSLLSGTCRRVTARTTAASGRFSRKTQRHPAATTIQPPSSGPTAPATPPTPEQVPTARARSFAANVAWMMASEPGAEGPPEQDPPGQRERMGGRRPLQAAERSVQALADGGQRDVDDRRIEHGHARPDHRRGEQPASRL